MPATEFTPFSALLGGAMIGLSAVLLMAFQGRIAGISGIVSRLFPPYTDHEFLGRLAFAIGLVGGPFVVMGVTGAPVSQTVPTEVPILIAGGLLVGFGAVWGNGCTSGHGVCGISRLSPRSLAATVTFMATGIITVFVVRHLFGG